MALDMLEMAAGNTELDRLRGIAARLRHHLPGTGEV